MANPPSQFPLRHVSIRVPWHDAGWNGSVCNHPGRNHACLNLINIAETRNVADETRNAGKSLKILSQSEFPPCVKERGTFMADFAFERHHAHPYSRFNSESHAHFRPISEFKGPGSLFQKNPRPACRSSHFGPESRTSACVVKFSAEHK